MRGNIDWIPCKEGQMPEDFDKKNRKVLNVLVTMETGKVTKVQRIRNEWHEDWYWGRICCNVKPWAPLPEKYEDRCIAADPHEPVIHSGTVTDRIYQLYDRSFRRDCHWCGISAVPEKEYTENDRRIIKKRGEI